MASAFGHFGRRSIQFTGFRRILHYDPCNIVQRSTSEIRSFHLNRNVDASIPVAMPALSPTMTEGTIVKWHKKEGDPISPGDMLCDIQTDKAVITFDIEEEGILAKILKAENSKNVKIGSMIAVMVEEGEDWQNAEIPESSESSSEASTSSEPSMTRVPPSITVSPEGGYQDIETTNMRRVIAKRLTESKTMIPHSYVSIECKVDAAMKLRKKFIASGTKISMNDIIVKAAGYSLQRVQKVNSHWSGDSIQIQPTVDISVAVATDSGLITPIVRNAAELSLSQISSTTKALAVKARDGKLQPQEFQGGSFTISNLGMFGIGEFSAIINPPQTAVLAVGTSVLKPSAEGKPCSYLTVKMSYDSRAIDETEASQFLEKFQQVMENPSLLMV
uniref:Dihydrolipoamide acetyltransferase component of pyruvate dehydrogenase complex n=2 Tax=Magallana gigas TaxID=29159 RepID=A0A8W8NR28_MAGGI